MRIEKTIDRESKQKLYVQIYSIFKEKIQNGDWPVGTQIPTEDELCKTYDVSKITVREAIHELVRGGYLRRQQGKGTFVTYPVPYLGLVMRTRLTEDMYGEGVKVEKEILERGVREPSEDVKRFLMTGDDIYYVLCRKIVDSDSYIEESFVPVFILPDIDQEDISSKSLNDLIEEKGTRKVSKVAQTMEFTRINRDIADLLKVRGNCPAVVIHRVFIASDGSPIAYKRLIGGGGGKSRIQMEFERIK